MLVRLKNKTPAEKRKGISCHIPCRDCKQIYVGETGWTLKRRIKEHKPAVRRYNEKNGVAVHVHKHDHQIDWDGASIVMQQQLYWRRRVCEAIYIQSRTNTINLDCGLKLSSSWLPFLALPLWFLPKIRIHIPRPHQFRLSLWYQSLLHFMTLLIFKIVFIDDEGSRAETSYVLLFYCYEKCSIVLKRLIVRNIAMSLYMIVNNIVRSLCCIIDFLQYSHSHFQDGTRSNVTKTFM